jgi:hypothetical protein
MLFLGKCLANFQCHKIGKHTHTHTHTHTLVSNVKLNLDFSVFLSVVHKLTTNIFYIGNL